MPFPLAHPAAVLPFRRYCPKYLNFAGLVVGSISPDVGYCFARLNLGNFSHSALGSVGFCLPVGVILLWLWYGAILPLFSHLPERYRQRLPLMSVEPVGTPLVLIISVLVGTWTHLVLDSLTHSNSWFVAQVPFLHARVFSVLSRNVRVCHLLWYGCSFAGVVVLFLAYAQWHRSSGSNSAKGSARLNWPGAVLLAGMVVPIELIHHLVHGALGNCLVAILTLGLAIGVALRFRQTERISTGQGP